ncbi:type IV toxin-antitoxin system AbiEi family antitoxin domain-containing protein [Candidatus Woesearchaeota archaeon]|nr:type IV toxin-antitoxin system AbiEi family antitoxin domain-containing protein [Candidatus Woesearchaeota archaeon]
MVTKKTERRAGLGKKSSQLLSELAENNKPIFTVDDAVTVLKEKKSSVTKLLHDLTRNKWLFRLSRGKYLILPLEAGVKPEFTEHEFIIASKLIEHYYISYWSALNYYGFTEQVSKTVFVATPKRKREMNLLGLKIKFITIKKDKFFGFKKILVNNRPVNIADKEKGIVDCLDLPRNCGGIVEVIKAIDSAKEELDFRKLKDYAKRMKNQAIMNRLGYILELLGIETRFKAGKHYVFLDPLIKNKISYNAKWKIIENIPKTDLLSWREH